MCTAFSKKGNLGKHIQFLLDAISDMNYQLAQDLILFGLIPYLNKPSSMCSNKHYNSPPKSAVQKLAAELLGRLFVNELSQVQTTVNIDTHTLDASDGAELDLYQRLKQKMSEIKSCASNEQSTAGYKKRNFNFLISMKSAHRFLINCSMHWWHFSQRRLKVSETFQFRVKLSQKNEHVYWTVTLVVLFSWKLILLIKKNRKIYIYYYPLWNFPIIEI